MFETRLEFDTVVSFWCNRGGTCPAKTYEEFTKMMQDAINEVASPAFMKWQHLKNHDDFESSTKFCGYGDMCCNNWKEPYESF